MHTGRRVGMADEADSKSVDGNIVRVQVPLPASYEDSLRFQGVFYTIQKFADISVVEKREKDLKYS